MRVLIWLVCAASLGAQDDLIANRERMRVSLGSITKREKAKADLLYTRRLEKRELLPDGQLKSKTVLVTRRDPWDETVVTRVISKDEKPLPPEETQKQEERLRKLVEERRNNPPKLKDDEMAWLEEMPDALDFHKTGVEQRNGRPTDVYEFSPRPGYKAKQARSRAFEKVKGKIWLDQQDNELAKLDALVFDTINVGFGVLGKVEKGTHFEMERRKWDCGMWFEEWQHVRFDVRVMMVKTMHQEIETRWSNVIVRPPYKMIRSGS